MSTVTSMPSAPASTPSSAAPAVAPAPLPAVPPVPVRRFTVDEYHRMGQAGILGEDENVELLEGWIVPKMMRNPPHDAYVSWINNRVLGSRLPAGWCCRPQGALTIGPSEPEPDIAVVRGGELDYATRHPGPADSALVVEVADSSLERDRTFKAAIYARASVPVYWIINLVDRQVEVYTDPTGPDPGPAYRTRRIYRPGDLVPFVVDGRELGPIPAQELLP
jgi:Uma2 family endonuclease